MQKAWSSALNDEIGRKEPSRVAPELDLDDFDSLDVDFDSPDFALLRDLEYRFIVPPGWQQFPVKEEPLRQFARKWLLWKYRRQSRDATVSIRRQIENRLVELSRAELSAANVTQMFMLSARVDVAAISASLVVAVSSRGVQGHERLREYVDSVESSAHDDAEVRVLTSPEKNLVVVITDTLDRGRAEGRTDAEIMDLVSEYSKEEGRPIDVEHLDDAERATIIDRGATTRTVEVHAVSDHAPFTVRMVFTTAQYALFEQLTELFIAIASTVSFRVDDKTWVG